MASETLKPLDLLILCKLAANNGRTYGFLSESLGISRSHIHKCVKRLEICGFLNTDIKVNKKAFLVFALGGARYAFPAEKKGTMGGVLTGLQAVGVADGQPMVWPCKGLENEKKAAGLGVKPLHPAALESVNDQKFWDLLALIDAIRAGDDKEAKVAMAILRERV